MRQIWVPSDSTIRNFSSKQPTSVTSLENPDTTFVTSYRSSVKQALEERLQTESKQSETHLTRAE